MFYDLNIAFLNLFGQLTFSKIEILISIFSAAFFGLVIRLALSLSKQNWVKTYHNTLTFILLPVITFVITSLISNNIALSIGMVGALSIVRFRNPVKNPFELVMYFGLITLGIAASIKILWGFLLTGFISFVIIFINLIDIILQKFNKKLFNFSFEEANLNYVADIQTSEIISNLEKNSLMINFNYDFEKKIYNYRLGSNKKNEIVDILEKLDKKNIININYSNL